MAYTVVRVNSVFGNERVAILKITTDAATQNVGSGLSVIHGIALGIISCNSANFKIGVNSATTGTAVAGTLGITGCTSGDVFYVTCFGA
jgi:hypothetical protein